MKKFTLILISMLFFLVGGVKADPTPLLILGGTNWRAVSLYDTSLQTYQREYGSWGSYDSNKGESFYQTAIVKFEGNNEWGNCNLGQGQWKAAFVSGQQHRFVITFTSAEFNSTNYNGPSMDLQLIAIKNNSIIKTADISEGASSGEITITEDYDEVVLIKTKSYGNDAYIPIASITREILTASSVAAPTISPASGTYDEDEGLTVTITKGEGNAKVTYSVSGATTGNVTESFTEDSKELTLTGTGTITVTATGYDAENNPSSEVTNTYTTDVPSGKTSIPSSNRNLPYTFNSADDNIEFNGSQFNDENIVIGNYVVLDIDVNNDNTWFCFKRGWGDTYIQNCSDISSGETASNCWVNQNDTYWWLKISDSNACTAFRGNNIQIKGSKIKDTSTYSAMTVNSFTIYESKAISELEDNSISSKVNNVVVELTRSFVAGTWNTVCLPFSLTTAQATQLFGSGYQLAQFTGVSGTTIQFTTTNSFVAGVPYLVWPTKDVSNSNPVVLVDVNIAAKTPQTVTYGGYSFVGTFTTKTFTGTDNTTSRFVATGNELKTPNENSTLKSLRCYFTVPAAAARSLSFDVDEEGGTTAIDVRGKMEDVRGDFFNLAGQRVAKPTKGLYIVNGKKVVIK